jgi:GTPase KRas protein
METSARMEVNIEETFALIVRRVMEARREVELGDQRGERIAGGEEGSGKGKGKKKEQVQSQVGPADGGGGGDEKKGLKASGGSFWRRLRCW